MPSGSVCEQDPSTAVTEGVESRSWARLRFGPHTPGSAVSMARRGAAFGVVNLHVEQERSG
jgi:hypothetical protein